MPILDALDHVTLRSTDLARSVAFYESALGLRSGPRPAFGAGGCWLHAGRRPALHLLEAPPLEPGGTAFDHYALAARGRLALAERLARIGVPFELSALPDGSALQMFVHDPDGVRLQLLFRSGEDR